MRARRLAAVAFLLGGLLPLGGVAPAACAAEGPHAALVVDTEAPAGQFRYCVALPDGSVTGIELIQLASEQHGLQYRLGYGGNVVCQLAGVGYSSDECLKDGPEFWGYWRGDGSGGWVWSSSGAQATIVRDGDVEGWSWGTGNDGSTHPAPPPTTFTSVCATSDEGERDDDDDRTEDDRGSKRSPNEKRSAGKAGSGNVAGAADREPSAGKTEAKRRNDPGKGARKDDERGSRRKKDEGRAEVVAPSPSASATATPDPLAADRTSSEGGPPVGGLIAVVATVGLMAAGRVVQRRRARLR